MTNQTLKLDLKDKKILYELDLNARQPCSQIAKKVGLSTEVVNYRIKKLEEEIIKGYRLVVDLSKLGVIQFKICLSFQHMNSETLNPIIEKLNKNKSVKWLVSCNGNWDMIISLETNSIENIDSLKEEILSLFGNYVNKKSLAICVSASNFVRNHLINKNTTDRSRTLVSNSEKSKIEDLDMKILKILSENSRKSLVEIASELNTTARIVNYRINQMIKRGIISGFNLELNYEKLGLNFYKVFLYLDNPSKEKVKKLINYFEFNKNITHHVKVLGNWDLEPEFESYSEKEFNDILSDMKEKFSDIIKNAEILTISKEHKFIYF